MHPARPSQPTAEPADKHAHQRPSKRAAPPLRITLNLVPMIDVTFLLLIFFLVTTTFKRAEGIFAAQLPEDAGLPTVALPISPIIVRISAPVPGGDDYQIRIDNFTEPVKSFGKLASFLTDVRGNPGFDRQTPVVIFPSTDVRWDHVVNCWNAAVRAQCENITFAGG